MKVFLVPLLVCCCAVARADEVSELQTLNAHLVTVKFLLHACAVLLGMIFGAITWRVCVLAMRETEF